MVRARPLAALGRGRSSSSGRSPHELPAPTRRVRLARPTDDRTACAVDRLGRCGLDLDLLVGEGLLRGRRCPPGDGRDEGFTALPLLSASSPTRTIVHIGSRATSSISCESTGSGAAGTPFSFCRTKMVPRDLFSRDFAASCRTPSSTATAFGTASRTIPPTPSGESRSIGCARDSGGTSTR